MLIFAHTDILYLLIMVSFIKKLKVLSNTSRVEDYIRMGLRIKNIFVIDFLLFPFIFIGGGKTTIIKNITFYI